MNKFTENECLPTFKFKLKLLENLRRPLTLKSTRKRIEEKNKMQRRGKKAKRQFLPGKTKQALRKKTKQKRQQRSARVDCHSRVVKLSALSLGYFISFSFATKDKRLLNSMKYHYFP